MASETDEELKTVKKQFERRVKIMLAEDDADVDAVAKKLGGAEPLDFWWRYILWARKNGTPLFVDELCKRCVSCFNEKPGLLKV